MAEKHPIFEILDTEIESLESSIAEHKDNLDFLRAVLSPDANVNNPSQKMLAELLELDPNIDLYELVTGTTSVSLSVDGKEIVGTYGFEKLVRLLESNDMLTERGRSVVDRFLNSASDFKDKANTYSGDDVTEEVLSGEIGQLERWRDDLNSVQPHRFIPALEAMEESGSGFVGYSQILELETLDVTEKIDRDVAAYFAQRAATEEVLADTSRSIRPGGGLARPASDAPTTDGAVAGSNAAPDETNPYTGGIVSNAADATVNPEVGQARRIGSGTVEPSKPLDLSFLNPDTPGPPGPGGPPRLSAAEQAEANQAEVEALLASQFGGFAFFLQKNKTELMVGLTADGMVVAADDPTAVSAKNVLDVIVEQGITDPTRVTGILQNTEWWKNTDAVMRQFDANYGEMSEPQKLEFLEPVLDDLRDEARFLGFEMSTGRARELAEKITREGEAGDSEYIRGLMVLEGEFNSMETEMSDFGAARDQIEAMSRSYYVPIGTEEAAQWAEDVYVGTKSATQVEQYFKEMAINKFPTLKNAIEGGLTADQYFAPYKYEIEKMLGRPNVDMYEEFGDVIEYMPDIGGDTPRPMTLGEVRKYVRGLDEWQTSASGQDSARSLAFAIGRTFGEVA